MIFLLICQNHYVHSNEQVVWRSEKSNSDWRTTLQARLREKKQITEDLTVEEQQRLTNAENSDFVYVLAYITYAKIPVSRVARVVKNKSNIYNILNEKQRDFVSYILRN